MRPKNHRTSWHHDFRPVPLLQILPTVTPIRFEFTTLSLADREAIFVNGYLLIWLSTKQSHYSLKKPVPLYRLCKYHNATKNEVLDNLSVISQEEKLVSKRRHVCLTMWHDDFDYGQILHAITQFCKVSEDGPIKSLFGLLSGNDLTNNTNVAAEGAEIIEREIPSILNEDISNFWAQGFSVDDNNEPAPENILTSTDTATDGIYKAWGSEPLDKRRVLGVRNVQPALVSVNASMHTVFGFFLHFWPMDFFKATILQATNKTP